MEQTYFKCINGMASEIVQGCHMLPCPCFELVSFGHTLNKHQNTAFSGSNNPTGCRDLYVSICLDD